MTSCWWEPSLKISTLIILLLNSLLLQAETTTTVSPTLPDICFSIPDDNEIEQLLDKAKQSSDVPVCQLNMERSEYCKNWRVLVIIFMQNNKDTADHLNDIREFVNTVTEYCDKKNTIMFFSPGDQNKDCRKYEIGSNEEKEYLRRLSPQTVSVPQAEQPGERLADLIQQMGDCQWSSPVDDHTAGAVFVFNNYPCEALCASTRLYSTITQVTFNLTYSSRSVVRIFSFDNAVEDTCSQLFLMGCSILPNSHCFSKNFKNSSDFLEAAEYQHTCAMTKSSVVGLALAIAIPCVILTIAVAVIVVILVKKHSRKRWFHFWKEQSKEQKETEIRSNCSQNDYLQFQEIRERDQWEVDVDCLTVSYSEKLGSGAFANVFKGRLTGVIPVTNVFVTLKMKIEELQGSSCEVAVKKLPNHSDEQSKRDFQQEMEFMKLLGYHVHIASLIGCVSSPSDPMILVEYCQHGDLLRFLKTHRGNFISQKRASCPLDVTMSLTLKDLLSLSWQISDGMVYLSSQKFIHRDLAARNILLTKNLTAKIGDFGLCRHADSLLYTSKGGRLPIKWMAIESLKFYEFTSKSDVWSFAVLLFEIFSLGMTPFQGIDPQDMAGHLEMGHRMDKPQNCPDEIYALMSNCWVDSPERRPSFVEIRLELKNQLNSFDEQYGYLALEPMAENDGIARGKNTSKELFQSSPTK